ncbi:MAG: crossover junction endodeoxyribonuclease RuvC [Phycisphaerales bacterium]|nr:crossover junction endodeoxyribonuclease RuvC [Phycisphaerales bacterium]
MTNDQTRVLGIDPGLNLTGYGCITASHHGTTMQIVEAGVIRIPSNPPLHERLAHLHAGVTEILRELKPELIVVESAFVHRTRGQTALQMGHGRGVILLAAAQYQASAQCGQGPPIAMTELSPAEIKAAVAGHGRATKEQIQHAVASILSMSAPIDQPDAADALAIAIAAAGRHANA